MEHGGRVERSTGRERFPKSSHLRSSQDFQRVRRRGKRQQGPRLHLSYARREAGPDGAVQPSRIGLAVNKRVGSAVQRNRVKRRLREAIRRRLWKAQPGWDMIVTARPESADANYAALADELHELLTRARLLREETF
ncbi:MAG TPA: ribonuclease P protein component [Ktedonobacterales bacterium]